MTGTLGQVGFFVALILVIVIHEAAHFGVAKWFRIKVDEFFVGFGPRIWSTKRGETEVGFRWIPAGGYVKIAGMSPYEEVAPEDLPRTFGAKPIWQRSLVIAAGPTTHLVLAFLCFALWLGIVGQPDEHSPLVTAITVEMGGVRSPAAEVGLKAGDRIVAVDDLRDPTDRQLVAYTRDHVGQDITLTVQRGSETFTVTVAPVLATVDGERVGRIGVILGLAREPVGPIAAISGGAGLVWDAVVQSVERMGGVFSPDGVGRVFRLIFTDAERAQGDPASVVGIGKVAGQTAQRNPGDLLVLFAWVNVFIGLLNLLPLPPFDGGHLAVLAIEKVRGKKVDPRKIVPIAVAVAAFFILFTLSVVYVDIVKPPV
jgi:membrane-associated protease RseP (regulator of RpoE activity)